MALQFSFRHWSGFCGPLQAKSIMRLRGPIIIHYLSCIRLRQKTEGTEEAKEFNHVFGYEVPYGGAGCHQAGNLGTQQQPAFTLCGKYFT